jgi:D-tyrosyl-tRNA(Tyr) deacylase
MKIILQRVTQGQVTVEGEVVGNIERGFVALVGVTHDDTQAHAAQLAKKTANLRVFEDDEGKMNRSMLEIQGEILVISQFTLYADARKGRRPSFIDAAPPEIAAPLVEHFADCMMAEGVTKVARGLFGANMQVEIHNDGPVTIVLDSRDFA